ncbi:MAG: HPP family protein [Methylocystaceae bacterium]|nr:MAG: HPP family protein [Methylocystaceae bacterium]
MAALETITSGIISKGRSIASAGIGGFALISLLGELGGHLEQPLLLGSFGASCVLVFGFPELPFSQPRNVIIGHALSSFIGLGCLTLFGPTPWAMAGAVGMAIMLMMGTQTVHPPAGSNPVIIFLTQPSWAFLFAPTLVGAVLIIGFALIYNNVARGQKYPKHW